MSVIHLLLVLLMLARDSLQANPCVCAEDAAKILSSIQVLEQKQEKLYNATLAPKVHSKNDPLLLLLDSWLVLFGNQTLTIEEFNNNARNISKMFREGTLKVQCEAKDMCDTEPLKEVKRELGTALKEVKDSIAAVQREMLEMKQMASKAQAESKKEKEVLIATLQGLRTLIESQRKSSVAEVEPKEHCSNWKAKTAGLELKNLETGLIVHYNLEKMNHTAAIAWCEARGLRLARLENFIKMLMVAQGAPTRKVNAYWVAASDAGSTPGDFKWTDGTKVEADLWYSEFPSQFGAGKETCVALGAGSGKDRLEDAACSGANFSICEVDTGRLGCL